jgi:hypothetical protein
LIATVLVTGAAPPEVVRVHIPAGKVTTWFPEGTTLRMMSPEAFDGLLEQARSGAQRQSAPAGPRLIRARHHARWEHGMLVGGSELVAETSPSGPPNLELVPWTPMIVPRGGEDPAMAALASGKSVLRLQPKGASSAEKSVTVSLDWKLRALPGTGDRSFALGLPGNETSVLSLELPRGWVPFGPPGDRQGPMRATREGFDSWQFYGLRGEITLRLVKPGEHGAQDESLVWVSGPTEVWLGPSVDRAGAGKEGLANWKTDWVVKTSGQGTVRFSARLDPGLELLDVSGTEVREFRVQRQGPGSLVSVVLAGLSGRPVTVHFEARASVPFEGTWRVPAMAPVDAVWTGGITTLTGDRLHMIRECRELAGVRLPTPGQASERESPGRSASLVFEASSAEAVADIVFRQPRSEQACQVSGQIRVLKHSPPEFECRLSGLGALGSTTEVQFDVSPGWTPDRVAWAGMDEPLSWQAVVQPDGKTRLRVLLSGTEVSQAGRSVIIAARSAVLERSNGISLPRVRPIGIAALDETWVARVDSALTLYPIKASGLSWTDESQAEGLTTIHRTPGGELRTALAWRWIADSAEAVVECHPLDQGPRVEIRTWAAVDSDGHGLLLDGVILVQAGTLSLTELPISLSTSGGLAGWSFRLAEGGPELPIKSLDQKAKTRLGLRDSATAVELSLPRVPRDGLQRITFRARFPWGQNGQVPLLCVPKWFLPRGTILIEAPARLHSQVTGTGLRRIEIPLAEDLAASWQASGSPTSASDVFAAGRPTSRLTHAFTYTDPDVEMKMVTEELTATAASTLIREALLTTMADPRGRSIDRLRLLLQGESARSIELELPAETTMLRVQVDGVPTRPSREGSKVLVALPHATAGARSWTIDLEYERTEAPLTAGSELRPVLPTSDLPCLAFQWELITPPRWSATPRGPGLTPSDPPVALSWPAGHLGLANGWRRPQTADRGPDGDTVNRLDDALSKVTAAELTFAEWFTRWDSPAMPLVIDRLAVSSIGYGPRSPCLPSREGPSGQSASLRSLRQYGLALVTVDSALVITSLVVAWRPGAGEDWSSAIAEAQLWGSDRADRFQTAARWCGEATPREAPPGVSRDWLRPPPGWSSWKFTGTGWPESQDRVVLHDSQSQWAPGWAMAGLTLVAMNWRRRWSLRRSALFPLAGMAVAVVLRLWLGDRLAGLAAGLLVGSALGLLFRVGSQLAASRPRESGLPGRRSSLLVGQPRSLLLRATVLTPILLSFGRDHAAARREPAAPGASDPCIPVLIPYDGAYDPSTPPRQVILRQSDYRALQELANVERPIADSPMILSEATHHISFTHDDEVVITSDLLLYAASPTNASWSVPIARSRDISATLDGQAVPVFIAAGGEIGDIPVPGSGSHRLRVRRLATRTRVADADSLRFPVNPLASARLNIEPLPARGPLRGVNARGAVMTGSGQKISAELGPVDQIELTWGQADPPGQTRGFVDQVRLWDIEPAGDVLRARFTYRGTGGLSSLRFQTDPGLLPRKLQIPGLVAATWSGPADHPIWTLSLDPPLVQPAAIELEMWRSLAATPESRSGTPTAGERQPGESSRRLPRLEPLDVGRGPGLLGVRRPGHWTGRLEPLPRFEPLSDESFVKTWGPLPDDRLTLSGTTRFGPSDVAEFQTGPAAARLKVQPTVQLSIDAGRVELRFEADMLDPGGSPDQFTLNVPAGLVITAVQSDGLADWNRLSASEVRLRYDQAARSRRQLRLSGHIPVPSDPLRPGVQSQQIPTPWLVVAGMDVSPGTLTIRSDAGVELSGATGLTPLPAVTAPTPPGGGLAGSLVRQDFRVDEAGSLGSLRWNSRPPRVSVHIESQLTLYPDSAEWSAVLQYDILGGPLDSFPLKLPTAWALRAQVEFDGGKVEPKSAELGPLTFWRIIPQCPAWGSRRLVLRSAVPLIPGQEIQHPEVSPLGKGGVDTYLGLVTATTLVPMTAGSSSLKEVIGTGRFTDPEFWRIPGTGIRVFHVARENWSLRAQIPAPADEPPGRAWDSARVTTADLNLTILPDHSFMGRGLYETRPKSGRYLIADPPRSAKLLWAAVDQNPVRTSTTPDGRWLIPLADGGPHRVGLYWKGELAASQPPDSQTSKPPEEREWSVDLPRVGPGRAATLATIHAPEDLIIRPILTDLELVPFDRLELERADRIARQINEYLGQMDRRSGRDREHIISLLIAHELAIRTADRSLRLTARKADRGRRERAERDLEIVRAARKALLESLRAAALEDEVDAALVYLGQPPSGNQTSTLAVAAPPAADRIRSLGQPSCLIGVTAGLDEEPTRVSASVNTDPIAVESPERARAILLLGLLSVLAMLAAVRPGRIGTIVLILAVTIGLLGLMGGPVALTGGLIVALASWLISPPRPRTEAMPGTA